MPSAEPRDKTTELLEKLLAIQLHSMGATQSAIARIVGKSKTWVNDLLNGITSSARAK